MANKKAMVAAWYERHTARIEKMCGRRSCGENTHHVEQPYMALEARGARGAVLEHQLLVKKITCVYVIFYTQKDVCVKDLPG